MCGSAQSTYMCVCKMRKAASTQHVYKPRMRYEIINRLGSITAARNTRILAAAIRKQHTTNCIQCAVRARCRNNAVCTCARVSVRRVYIHKQII